MMPAALPDPLPDPLEAGAATGFGLRKLLLWLTTLVGLLVAIGCGLGFLSYRTTMLDTALKQTQDQSERAAKSIEAKLATIEASAKGLEESLDKADLGQAEVEAQLRAALDANPDALSVGVAYTPFAHDPKVRLYAPVLIREGEKVTLKDAGTFNEYTAPNHDWYSVPLEKGPTWLEPHYGVATNAFLVQYARPFRWPGQGKPRGVVFVNYSLERIRDQIASLEVGKTGYAFIISKTGAYVSHPVSEFYREGRTLYQQAKEKGQPKLDQLAREATAGHSGSIDYTDPETNQDARYNYRPLGNTGLSLITKSKIDEIGLDQRLLHRFQKGFALGMVAFLAAGVTILLRADLTTHHNVWKASFASAVVMMLGIGYIWNASARISPYLEGNNTKIVDRLSLSKFQDRVDRDATRMHLPPPQFVPTGFFIETVDFTQAYNADVMGYVWQRFKKGQEKITRGVVFAEATSTSMNEAYRRKEGDYEVVGWQFKSTLRQQFDYSRYPFDQQDIWVRLWPKDVRQNVWLVPDLASYDQTVPTALPGLEHDLVLAGWKIDGTFFDFKPRTYNTNFGVTGGIPQHDVPELHFNILLRRNVTGPFISNIIPLVMVTLMLFSTMMGVNPKDKPWVIIGSIASSFFTIVLAHSKVRDTFGTSDIIYMEYFYLVMYMAVGYVALNSFLYATNTKWTLITTRENLIPRLAYCPLLVGSILIITALVFK